MKFTTLPDYSDYLEVKNGVLIVHEKPIRNNGTVQLTDPNIINNWPKTIEEFIERYKKELINKFKINNIIRVR